MKSTISQPNIIHCMYTLYRNGFLQDLEFSLQYTNCALDICTYSFCSPTKSVFILCYRYLNWRHCCRSCLVTVVDQLPGTFVPDTDDVTATVTIIEFKLNIAEPLTRTYFAHNNNSQREYLQNELPVYTANVFLYGVSP